MSSGVVLSKEFAYPAAAVVSTFYLLFWQTLKVSHARKQAKVDYPQVYAEKAEAASNKNAYIFNCTQRAHQNTLEVLPVVIGSTLISGVTLPKTAAAICGTWVFFRVLYTIGYSTGDPKKRNLAGAAGVNILALLGLIGTATYSVVSLISSL
ncbi:membrane-associated proteins in eicosanoid and glutathione metabolism [Fomes fomentarius]|nr:membrane-associated proteins in eicosanoid and glutathione metabolism [Fomes fomentarius]